MSINRREFISTVAGGMAVAGPLSTIDRRDACPTAVPERDAGPGDVKAGSVAGAKGLAAPAFQPLPIGAIRPAGWLQRQLRLQADGLSGHLDEFWPDVGQSQWFGGKAEGWERAPYWLDGVIPLAWILDDAPLKDRITRYVDFILSHQRADGWFGPYPEDAVAKRYDMWAILLANKALVQYHEATGDARGARGGDARASGRCSPASTARRSTTGASSAGSRGSSPSSTSTSGPAKAGCSTSRRSCRAQGFDFEALYAPTTSPCRRRGAACGSGPSTWSTRRWPPRRPPVSWRIDQRPADRAFAWKMIEILDRHHGQVTGMFTRRRVPGRPQPAPGHRTLRGRRVPLLARTPVRRLRRRRRSPTAWSGSPSTPCRRRSRPTCGRTSTTSRSTRCSARSIPITCGPPTGPSRTCTAWSRTSAAARPTCTRAGPSSPPISG